MEQRSEISCIGCSQIVNCQQMALGPEIIRENCKYDLYRVTVVAQSSVRENYTDTIPLLV